MKKMLIALCAGLFSVQVSAADVPAKKSHSMGAKAPKRAAEMINTTDLKWADAPPVLPKGAQLAVIHGDPFAKGPFAVRFKMPDGYKIAAHWHSTAEQLTVLSGAFVLHLGDSFDAPSHELNAGGYHFLPARMHHAVEAKGETVLQVNGEGPFDLHYLNPADDPSKGAEAKK